MFTGAAACAAGLAPMAQAAPAVPTTITPDTTGASCGPPYGHPTQDLVLYYSGGPGVHHAACFVGINGNSAVVGGNPLFSAYCDYNEVGYLWIGGIRRNFTPGGHNLHQHVSKVLITGTTTPSRICTTN
jgi:hypothetical protein